MLLIVNSLRYRFRVFAGGRPLLFFPLYGMASENRGLMVRRDTELVIEGFPRSANTFAVVAFESAQTRRVRLAHHLHAQSQVIRAVEFKFPTCVLIREPTDAIRSLIVRHKFVSWTVALKHYLDFYGDLLDLHGRFVVATFGQVVGGFDTVIARINRRFGTKFGEFVNSEDATRSVMDAVDAINMRLDDGRAEASARPLPARNSFKNEISLPTGQGEIELLDCARRLFQSYSALAER